MNSILHTCTHPRDGELSHMTDDQMYAAIFKYIEHLFAVIKPKKAFYMAIDGVAPRAKMNQQRARRFRTAAEAEENLKKAIARGETLPKEDPFDSNAITPGTEFMAKLTRNLKYFIHKKILEDRLWADCTIILSGHEVPGEGEHKIMEYIRTMKLQPDYNPNTRHCVYGLDADLIMLGLVSHDPHFALLREEVTFGPSRKVASDVSEQKFFLLHLSLLREYLELEFRGLEGDLLFEYLFEKILDDFILIMYVIGNDFLPNLPDLFINKGAFPLLLETFKQSLRLLDGYLNENGTINLRRLGVFFTYLSEFEQENFEKVNVDVEWFNKKLEDISVTGEKRRERFGKILLLKDQKKLIGFIKPWLLSATNKSYDELVALESEGKGSSLKLPKEEVQKHLDFIRQFALEVGLVILHLNSEDLYTAKLDIDGISPHETEEEHAKRVDEVRKVVKKYQLANIIETEEALLETKSIYDAKFVSWKDSYYKDKLHFLIHDEDKMVEFTKHYIEGLQWVLYYYYKGCRSWNWYYKYHYAPRISDVIMGINAWVDSDKQLEFELSKPFKPFEQLMAVLPARSRNLMPAVYRPLMTDEHSPIIDFYPNDVDIDMNGKTASWEAVVLLLFVDEKRLIAALKPLESKLSPEETERNSYGRDILFEFHPQIDQVYSSPLPGYFADLEHDRCNESSFILPEKGEIKSGLPSGVSLGKEALAGFPTLELLDFTYELKDNETLVFQQPLRSQLMVLTIEDRNQDITVEQFARKYCGRLVYANWPFLRELKIVSVQDENSWYEQVKNGQAKRVIAHESTPDEKKDFINEARRFRSDLIKRKGIDIGEVTAILEVKPVTGLIRTANGAMVKTFQRQPITVPLQLIVEDVVNKDSRYVTRAPIPLEKEYPNGQQVVFLGAFAFGSPTSILGHEDGKLNVAILKIQLAHEPTIGRERWMKEQREITYLPSFEVAKRLKINGLLLLKITSLFQILDEQSRRVNIGLELKFESRRQKVLGYTRKLHGNQKVWEFSPLAVNLINEYRLKFPSVFKKLTELNDTKAIPKWDALFKDKEEFTLLRKWLKELRPSLVTVLLELELLTKFLIEAVENFIIKYVSEPIPFSQKDIRGVPREAVINPVDLFQLLSTQRFELGDRVVYVQESGKVPFLSKGTVVGITSHGTKVLLNVLFDMVLLSGNNMAGRLKTSRGVTVDSLLVLNISSKQLVYHSRALKSQKPRKPQPVHHASGGAGVKASIAPKLAPKGNQNAEVAPKPKPVKKQPNQLLSLLKKKKSEGDVEGEADGREDDGKDEEGPQNPNAIKAIYGHIYSNVMNEGLAPYHNNVPAYYPVPPQGLPVPVAVPQAQGPAATEQNGKHVTKEANGHNGSYRGRGRGNFRGRGNGRGRGRGRGGKVES